MVGRSRFMYVVTFYSAACYYYYLYIMRFCTVRIWDFYFFPPRHTEVGPIWEKSVFYTRGDHTHTQQIIKTLVGGLIMMILPYFEIRNLPKFMSDWGNTITTAEDGACHALLDHAHFFCRSKFLLPKKWIMTTSFLRTCDFIIQHTFICGKNFTRSKHSSLPTLFACFEKTNVYCVVKKTSFVTLLVDKWGLYCTWKILFTQR